MLQVNFIGKNLLDIYQYPKKWLGDYPPWIIKSYIKLVTLMQTEWINDITEINKFWNYQIWPKQGDMKWIWAGRLNDGRRLEFTKDENWWIQIINLTRISNHYK